MDPVNRQKLGACLRGRTATQRSKKGSGKGSGKWVCYGFYSQKRVLRRVLRSGSEKGVSRRCPERPLVEYTPLGARPKKVRFSEPRLLQNTWFAHC